MALFYCLKQSIFNFDIKKTKDSSLAKPLSWTIIENKQKNRTNLKTQLFEVRHMSRPTSFYLGLPNSVPKPSFSNVCGLHLRWTFVCDNPLSPTFTYSGSLYSRSQGYEILGPTVTNVCVIFKLKLASSEQQKVYSLAPHPCGFLLYIGDHLKANIL